MNRKVIFVGGTEFSGSTFFHMTLANDPRGFATGEAFNFFRPTKPWHFGMHCSCGDASCTLWNELSAVGEDHFYEAIFDRFPEVEFIVDSSKNPSWIRVQQERLDAANIESENVLIWKTPLELAHSYRKRGNTQAWERSWVVYHRMYHTLIADWRSVSYRGYVDDPAVLRDVCLYCDIPYFEDKKSFWNREYHAVGGNPSARIHLYSKNSDGYEHAKENSSSPLASDSFGNHRQVYAENIGDEELQKSVSRKIRENPFIPELLELLAQNDVQQTSMAEGHSSLRVQKPLVQMRSIKHKMMQHIARHRYG